MMKVTPLILAATTLFTVVLAAAAPDKFVVTEHVTVKAVEKPSTPVINVFDDALTSIQRTTVSQSTNLRVQWLFFTAPLRCAPCVGLSDRIETRLIPTGFRMGSSGNDHFRKILVDDNESLRQQYNVTVIPTMLLVVDGVEVDRVTGFDGSDRFVDSLANKWNAQAVAHPVVIEQPSFQAISIAEVTGQANISKLFDMLQSRGNNTVIHLDAKAEIYMPSEMGMSLDSSPSQVRLRFTSQRPRLKYATGILSVGQELSGVVLERDRAVLELPGFPDLQVTLKP